MRPRPTKFAETIVALLLPPACREEVPGDLHERYRSPLRYALDSLTTVPLVIFSRICRTLDAQMLLIQTCACYLSFIASAWLIDRTALFAEWGLLRLAIPAAAAMPGCLLSDAYARVGHRTALSLSQGPLLGVILAVLLEFSMRVSSPELAVSGALLVYGCSVSFLLCSAVRIWLAPITGSGTKEG